MVFGSCEVLDVFNLVKFGLFMLCNWVIKVVIFEVCIFDVLVIDDLIEYYWLLVVGGVVMIIVVYCVVFFGGCIGGN